MSPHQSKTGVYVFFCIRAKLIHVFVSELLLLSSLSLLLLLSFAGTFLFSLVTTTILCVDHCVSGVNLCRRRSVAFVHRGKRTQKKMHPESQAILGTSSEKDAHFARSRAFFECDAHAFGVRVGRRGTRCGATGSVVLIWDQRRDVTWTARDRTELWSELEWDKR